MKKLLNLLDICWYCMNERCVLSMASSYTWEHNNANKYHALSEVQNNDPSVPAAKAHALTAWPRQSNDSDL
jgi:hypothetical protein